MMMKRTLALATALVLAAAACGDEDPTGPDGNDGEMEATVGGAPFEASTTTGTLVEGTFNIAGTETSGSTTTVITINVVDAEEGGTFDLDPTVAGTFGQVTITGSGSTSTWTTTLSPGEGSITFTTLSADRAAGTFQFTGQASSGTSATGQKTVTSGTFDIEF